MNRKQVFYSVIVSILLLFSMASWADRSMNLYVGQVRPVAVGKVARVAVGKDSILQTIVLEDGQILFIPTGPGETDVKIWLKNGKAINYKFRIMEANIASRKVIAQSLLRTFPGLRVTAVDKHIIIEGKISPVDQKVFQSVIGKIPNVVSLVNPNKFNEYQIRKMLAAFGVEAVQIRRAGKRFVVNGEVDPRNIKILESVLGKVPNVSSLIRPKLFVKERMVRLKVHVAEIDSNYGRQLGIKWDESAAGPIFTAATPIISNDRFGIVPQSGAVNGVDFVNLLSDAPNDPVVDLRFATNILSRLNFLESNGRARTLSRPELLARSGETAEFTVGGSLPIVYTTNNGPQVSFQNYGVIVNMEPTVNRKNEIILKLNVEVSSVDTSVSVLGVPGLKKTSAKTTINAYHGRTIAIAGLLDVTGGNDSAQIPFLGNIPILGNLFKTKGKNFAKRELIFLVTPELVTPKTENNTPIHLREEIQTLESLQVPLNRDIRGPSFVTDILE